MQFVIRGVNRNHNHTVVEWGGALYGWQSPIKDDPKIFASYDEAMNEPVHYVTVAGDHGNPGDHIENVHVEAY